MQEGQTWPHLSTADLLAYRNCDILEKVIPIYTTVFILYYVYMEIHVHSTLA